ncbi:MAG TPA: hypothetical protein VIF60_23625 [Burkholderiaceae bacterium]
MSLINVGKWILDNSGNAMSINGIGNYQISANALYSGQNANPVDSSGDADRSRVTAPTTTGGRTGLFSSAISQTLFQIGVTPTASNVATGAAPTNTQQQALNVFAQDLFGALQSTTPQASTGAGTRYSTSSKKDGKPGSTTASADSAKATQSASTPNGAAGSGNSLESRLRGLIQQIGTGTSPESSGQEAYSALQQSFGALVAAQGGTGNGATLGKFLQALSGNLQDIPPTGSLISTSA